jgi:hypothetical protein
MEVAMDTVTKVRDLIAKLQECDPDGTVAISLDGAVLYDDEEPGEVDYSFVPSISCLFSTHAERSDTVYFCLSQDDTNSIVAGRRNAEQTGLQTGSAQTTPGIAMNAPVAVAVAFDHATYMSLLTVVASCNRAEEDREGATTHGKLDVPKLLAMLAEDAAMTNTRPGSWEGANMQQVLDSHGYQ